MSWFHYTLKGLSKKLADLEKNPNESTLKLFFEEVKSRKRHLGKERKELEYIVSSAKMIYGELENIDGELDNLLFYDSDKEDLLNKPKTMSFEIRRFKKILTQLKGNFDKADEAINEISKVQRLVKYEEKESER